MTVARVAAFEPDPGVVAALVASAGLYAAGVRRARRWPRWRSGAFAGGLVAVAVALLSGVDVYADRYLTVHMAQHLLLTLVAAPALVMGAPIALALRASGSPARRALARLSGAAAPLTHPATAFALLPVALVATHLTPFYDFALRHPTAHALEHALYLATALLFWTPVLGAEPLAHRLSGFARTAYLVAAMPATSVVAAVLVSAEHPLYTTYARFPGALADQQRAGALMWVGGALVMVAFALAVGWRAWEREERRQAVRDRVAAGGVR